MTDAHFETVARETLDGVIGGRKSAGPQQTDPNLLAAISQLAQTVQKVGEGLAQSGQASSQGMMQMMQQMMEAKKGGGGR
jgi:hypothetical protein